MKKYTKWFFRIGSLVALLISLTGLVANILAPFFVNDFSLSDLWYCFTCALVYFVFSVLAWGK